ncbi:MAG TPA: membrane dipeptidase [Rhizomicrobium sp.]|jgi:membrane dipeptidase|nr:membrane dipeptidase [Rhizomicrobium sp.]
MGERGTAIRRFVPRSLNRRQAVVCALAFAAAMPSRLHAQAVSPEVAKLYRRALVFDANLIPPMQDTFPFPRKLLDLIRQSGVVAMKFTIGGMYAPFESVIEEIAFVQTVIEEYPGLYLQVRTHDDFAHAKRKNRVGILLGFEHPNVLEASLERIELFRRLGVRVMQLTYYRASAFGMGTFGDLKAGLTPLGRKALGRMNEQGVAIDISHSNEATSFGVLQASSRPVLITHAGCTAVYAHPRNKSDALLRAMAEKGGVIGIYDLPYLTPSAKQPTLADYMAHMTHALSVCGEDHVGIGSDSTVASWDPSPRELAAFNKGQAEQRKSGLPSLDRPPYVIGLNTPRRCEVIADALLKRGYSARVAEKVLGLNFTDALGHIWKE